MSVLAFEDEVFIGVPRAAGVLEYKGSYNAITNTPDLDFGDSGVAAGILKGDTYTITTIGDFLGAYVEPGDELTATIDNPTLLAHWSVVNRNINGNGVSDSSNELWVDTSNTPANGSRGSQYDKYANITDAIAAAAAPPYFGGLGDVIHIAPEDFFFEAIDLDGKTIFFDAPLATGISSIDINGGVLMGRIGMIEYHEGGCIIHPTSSATANGDAFDFAWQVAKTGATGVPFGIGLLPSTVNYDLGSRVYNPDTETNAKDISVYGLGANKPHLVTSGSEMFKTCRNNHFKNLEITAASRFIGSANTGTITTTLEHIKDNSPSGIRLTNNATWTGHIHSLTGSILETLGGASSITGNITDITMTGVVHLINFTGSVYVNACSNFKCFGTSPNAHCHIEKGTVIISGEVGRLTFGRGDSTTGVEFLSGVLDFKLDGLYSTVNIGASKLDLVTFDTACRFSDSSLVFWWANRSVVELGVEYTNVSHTAVGLASQSGENHGKFYTNRFKKHSDSRGLREGLVVSDGAELYNSIFEDFDGEIAIRGRDLLSNSSNSDGYGSISLYAKYFHTAQTIVFPCSSEPQKSDGAGTGTVSGMGGDTFDARILVCNDQLTPTIGEELSKRATH